MFFKLSVEKPPRSVLSFDSFDFDPDLPPSALYVSLQRIYGWRRCDENSAQAWDQYQEALTQEFKLEARRLVCFLPTLRVGVAWGFSAGTRISPRDRSGGKSPVKG